MFKHLQKLLLIAALLVPWVTQAQTPGDLVSTFPYSCDFESTSVSGSWVTVNGTQNSGWYIGTAVNATVGGSTSLYVSGDNGVTNGYSIGTAEVESYSWAYQRFTMDAGVYDISFSWRCFGEYDGDPYDYFRVFIVPDNVTLTAGTLPSTSYTWSNEFMSDVPAGWIGINNGSLTYFVGDSVFSTANAEFTIPTTGNYKLVFLWLNDNNTVYNPAAAIDDIEIALSSCPAPADLSLVSIDASGINISWTSMGTETSWAVYVNGELDGVSTSSSYTISTPGQGNNEIAVAAICGAGDTSQLSAPISVYMSGDAVSTFPYTTGFEVDDDDAWDVVNDGTNKWYVGTGAHSSGSKGLYISNDNGTTNSYTNNATQFSYAYRAMNFLNSGQYAISFDWRCYGESNYDYLRAWIAPASAIATLAAGYDPEGGTSAYSYTTSTPAGWIDLGGKMNLQNSWQTCVATPSITSGSYILVFMWANDGSGGTTPPAAVDNIYVNQLSCPAPTALAATGVTSDEFTLNWNPGGTESEWVITISDTTEIVTSSTSYTVTNLLSNTLYTVKAYAVCGNDDTSMATTIQVRTACGDITVLPVTYNFDDQETGTSAPFAYCWTRINSTATYSYYPYITSNSSYAHSGSNCLYTYLYTSADYPDVSLAILPPIDSTVYQVENLELLFWASTSSSSYHPLFEVGVYVDQADTTYFMPYDTITVNYSSGVAEYSVAFDNYVGPQGRLAFRFLKSMMTATYSYCALYLDDVTIREINDCAVPADLTVNAANADSVMVSWQGVGDATSWELVYGVAGFNPDIVDQDSIRQLSDTVYYIEYLTGGVTYQVYVRSVCSDGNSYWAGPIAFTPGSINMGVTGSSTMYVCNAVVYDDGGATGNYSNSCHYTLTLYPNDDTKRFKFWGSGTTESTLDYLRVYSGTTASGVMLGQINGSNPTIDTVTTQGGPITLLFHSDGSVIYAGFELHVMCEDLPPCRDVADVTVQEVSTSSAYVTWTNAVGTTPLPSTYIVTVTDSTNATVATTTVTEMYAMVGGLDPNTSYTVSVVPDCDGSNGMPASTTFTTAGFGCLQVDATLAFSDTIGNGTSTSNYLPSYSFYNYGLTQQIFTAAEIGHGGTIDKFAFMMSTVTQQRTYEIYMGHTNVATANDYLHPSDLTLVYNGGPVTLTANQWTNFNLTTPFAYNGTDNLVIILRDMTGSYVSGNYGYVHSVSSGAARYAYQDSGPYDPYTYSGGTTLSVRNNIILGGAPCAVEASCAPPLFVITGKTGNTVDLMWAAGSAESSWSVEHKAVSDAAWTTDYASTQLTSATITGLTPNTEYQFRVYHLCGTDTFATVRTIRTDCVGTPVPFSEDFSTWTTGTAAPIPSCWFKGSTYDANYPYVTTTGMGDAKSMYFYASGSTYTYLALPKMDAPIDTLVVTGYVYYSSSGYQLNIGVMTDAEDYTTFHAVGGVSTVAYTWVPFEVILAGQPEGNIAFSNGNDGSYSYLYLDNIEVNYFNPCVRPTNVNGTGITTNTANISWTDTVTSNFIVEYGPRGFALGTGTQMAVTGNNVQLTGLAHSTMYDVYVRGVCSDSDTGDWSFVYNFATSCHAIDVLPFVENFDSWGTGSNVHAPNCWNYGSTYSTTYPYINTTAHSGAGSMYMYVYASSSGDQSLYTWFSLPELDASVANVNQTQVRFYTYTSTSSYEHRVLVGVSATPNATNVQWIDTVIAHYGVWEEQEVAFDAYTDTGRYIVFQAMVAPAYQYSYPYIDDITLEMIPSCQSPNNLSASNATSNTVDLAWNDRANASQWQIEYGPVGFTPGTGTMVIANSNPFTLTGLPSSYQGEFYVRAICSPTDTGVFSRTPCGFNTSQAAATIPYTYNFEDPAEWANWQVSSNVTTNWFRGTTVAAGNNGYSIYISADSGATYRPYQYQEVVNAAAFRDVDFGNVDTSFTITFDARVGGTISASYDGMMVFLVDPSLPTVPSNSNITSPWGNVNDLYRIITIRRDTLWHTYTASFDTIHGIKRVAFFWFNQNTQANYPNLGEPVAVDNIHIDYSACPRPVALTANALGSTSANLSWVGPAVGSYQVIYRPYPNGNVNTFVNCNTNSVTLTGLEPMTQYVAWVRKFCGNDTSLTCDGILFTTELCDGAVTVTNYGTQTATTSSYSPIGYSLYNYSYVQTIIDSAQLAALSNNGTVMDIVAFAFDAANTTSSNYYTNMDVYMANVSQSDLSSGFILQDSSFVQVISNGNFNFTDVGQHLFGFDTTFTWDGHSNVLFAVNRGHGTYSSSGSFYAHSFSTSKMRYVYNDGSAYNPATVTGGTASTSVGDIYLVACSGSSCRVPAALSANSVTYNSATLTWAGTATQYEVSVKAATESTWPASATVNNATSYTASGLLPATAYQFRVRAICDASENLISDWVESSFVTDSLPCFAPSNLQATPDNVSVTLNWEPGSSETQWNVHIWNSTKDTTVTVNTHPVVIGGLAQTTEYYAAVSALCGGLVESDFSDTVQFTTTSCAAPTGVAVSNVTATSAVVTWNGNAASYDISYGERGFGEGQGEIVTGVTGNTYTITGLEPEMAYDVYVRANCAAGVPSGWSENATFTTTNEGIHAADGGLNVTIYPNPTTSATTISLSGVNGEVEITIVDMNGRTVKSDVMSCDGDCAKKLTVDGLAAGAYFVRISADGVNAVKKLVVK